MVVPLGAVNVAHPAVNHPVMPLSIAERVTIPMRCPAPSVRQAEYASFAPLVPNAIAFTRLPLGPSQTCTVYVPASDSAGPARHPAATATIANARSAQRMAFLDAARRRWGVW